MIFLKDEELKNVKQSNIIQAISSSDSVIINEIELQVIYEIKSYISGRYDDELIFSQKDENRSPLIKRYVLQMMLYYLSLRIIADDIPSYLETMYDNIKSDLKDIANGRLNPDLPERDPDVEKNTNFAYGGSINFYKK